jgi:hypothetical protein
MTAFLASGTYRLDALIDVDRAEGADVAGVDAQAIDVFVFSDWTPMAAGWRILPVPSTACVAASMKPGHLDEHHHVASLARVVPQNCFGSDQHALAR